MSSLASEGNEKNKQTLGKLARTFRSFQIDFLLDFKRSQTLSNEHVSEDLFLQRFISIRNFN